MPATRRLLSILTATAWAGGGSPSQTIHAAPINVLQEVSSREAAAQQREQQEQRAVQQWTALQQQQQPQAPPPQAPSSGAPAGRSPGGAQPAERVAVRINGREFVVSRFAADRVTLLVDEFNATARPATGVSVGAAFLALWDLVFLGPDDVGSAAGRAAKAADVAGFDPDELVQQLSIPSLFNLELRRRLDNQFAHELRRSMSTHHEHKAQGMWRHLRDVIANPQRYKDGGIRIEKAPARGVKLRNPAGERFRAEAAWTGLTPWDHQQLAAMSGALWFFPASRDFVIGAEYLDAPAPGAAPPSAISARDRVLINEALLALPLVVRQQAHAAALHNARLHGLHRDLWTEVARMCAQRTWTSSPDAWLAGDTDEMGFVDDDPAPSDLYLRLMGY